MKLCSKVCPSAPVELELGTCKSSVEALSHQKIFETKTCVWFSIASVIKSNDTTSAKDCCSTACLNTVLSPVRCLCCKERLFPC